LSQIIDLTALSSGKKSTIDRSDYCIFKQKKEKVDQLGYKEIQ